MEIDSKLVQKAKDALGDTSAELILELLNVTEYDEQNMKACCPFHNEDTPSFIYDHKRHMFHCFGCHKNVDVIDAYMHTGLSYAQSVQKLFELTGTKYSFGTLGVKTKQEFTYPHDEPLNDLAHAAPYLMGRGLSLATIQRCGIREDAHGNIAFRYFDTNDVLTFVKYRLTRPRNNSNEPKTWCQKGASPANLLFNMQNINMEQPLLITEGEIDAMSAIESGFANAVSVPLGAGNTHWIDENYEWLEKFDTIILCGDNDEPGQKFMKEAAPRLGVWRVKTVELPKTYIDDNGEPQLISDINDVLVHLGKEKVDECISKANQMEVDSVVDFADIEDVDISKWDGVYSGLSGIDKNLSNFPYGTFNIVTGVNGCVDSLTQYFNGTDWKCIWEYEEGEKVLQYTEDGKAELVYPEQYIKQRCDEMLTFKSDGIDQLVTTDHTMVYIDESGRLATKPAYELCCDHNNSFSGFKGRFIQTFDYSATGNTNNMTMDELRLATASILVGNSSETMNHNKGDVTIFALNFKKLKHLQKMLDATGIPYIRRVFNKQKALEFKPPTTMRAFDGSFWKLRRNQWLTMLEEITIWRGVERAGQTIIVTRKKYEADYIQFIQTACGLPTRIETSNTYDDYGEIVEEYALIPLKNNQIDRHYVIPSGKSTDGFKYCFSVPSGMLVLRRNGVINITGNCGKSAFLSQFICQCMEQGKDTWLYSMELPNAMTKNWMQHVLAGPHHIKTEKDKRGSLHYLVDPTVIPKINEYCRGKIFVYKDGYHNKIDDVLISMESSARRYGCKLFVIDNLTAVNIDANESNKWDKQNDMVVRLIDFAKKFNVTVLLVIHPRKMQTTMQHMTKFDIQGSGGMCDLAHRAIGLYRVTPKEKDGIRDRWHKDEWESRPEKHDVICDILKDRFTGHENLQVPLFYDKPSMRFFGNRAEYNYQYGWETTTMDKSEWTYPDKCKEAEATPF